MDEDTKKFITDTIEHAFQVQHQNLFNGFKRVYDDIGELKKQVGKNCTKLDDMNNKLDSIVEIVTANGQGIEVLSNRIDKLE